MRTTFSGDALLDLEDILRHTERTWGRDQRARYQRLLKDGFKTLSMHPELGMLNPQFGEETRQFPIGSHIVIYRVSGDRLVIARVVDHRRGSLLDSDG